METIKAFIEGGAIKIRKQFYGSFCIPQKV